MAKGLEFFSEKTPLAFAHCATLAKSRALCTILCFSVESPYIYCEDGMR